jgi:pimeloyl-ACP methyl ester carboxylesterase
MSLMFGRTFLEDPSRAAERAEWEGRLRENRRDIWRAVNGVLYRRGVYEELARVKTPTLVLVGSEDVATVPARAERIHEALAGSKLVKLPRGGHTSTVEEPELLNAALVGFLDGVT